MRATLGAAALALISLSAQAALNPSAVMNEGIQRHPVGGGRPDEICIIPPHFGGASYSDKDLENEKRLCGLDKNSNATVKVKLNSTNPGLDFFSNPGGKKLAKYKLSTSCSYTPSILGYYHLSRMLGDILDVPVAVVRTFDLNDHVRLGRIAQRSATDIMAQTWKSLMDQLPLGARAPKRNLLMTSDFLQSYGALSKNPRGEEKYSEFFNGGAEKVERGIRFRDRNPVMQLLSKRAPVESFLGLEFNAATVQKLQQMKDTSEFIILDFLMNQQDRFGNIHAETRYYYLDQNNRQLESESELKPEDITRLKAVSAKRMILKDNDCGGSSRENVIKAAGLHKAIGHMDPETYSNLLKLNKAIDDEAVKKFFMSGLLFDNADFSTLRSNLRELSQQLYNDCKNRRLFLDLNLKGYFTGAEVAPSCDI